MSNTPFVESLSQDPVERALARKVVRILNDTTLDRQRREILVKKVQRELVEHRKAVELQEALRQQVATAKLPKGYQPQSAVIREGRVQVSGLNRQQGFVWVDAGKAPAGSKTGAAPIALNRPSRSKGGVKKDLAQCLAERRKALGYRQPADQS